MAQELRGKSAPGIVQFKDDFPIISSVPLADASKGYEAGAQVAGQAAEVLGQQAEKLAEQKSSFMLMQANDYAEDLKTNTKLQIKQNPDQADSIFQSYEQTAASIKNSTKVNSDDRMKLDALMNQDKNELQLTAGNETYRVQKRNAEIKLWGGYPASMKSLQDAIDSGDMKLAKQISENVANNFKNAAYADVTTPQQYANVLKSVGMLYDRAEQLHNLANNPDADAQDYHRLYASPFENDTTNNSNLPVNQSTVYLQQDGVNDKTMTGVQNAILNNGSIPFSTAASTDENFAKTLAWIAGRNEAKSLINSGNKFKIDTRMGDLDSKVTKTPREEMEYNYLKQYQQRLIHGESTQLMAETPMGARIIQDFNDRMNAIKIGGYTPIEAEKLKRDAYNNMIDHNISYWDAQHSDPRLTQPIPQEIVEPIAQAFKANGDANVALERMQYLDSYQKQAYTARAMPDPLSRETMQTIALANNSIGVRPEWKKGLIEAQQPVILKDLTVDQSDLTKIKKEIGSQLSDVLSYVSIGSDKNEPRSQALLEMAYNKVVYDGMKRGDLSLSNKDAYIKDVVDNIRMSYNIASGMTHTANLTQLNISQNDWSYISRHEQSEVYKNLYKMTSNAEVMAAIDRNPLMTTLTTTNHIVVMDSYGNVLSNHPYSDKLRIKAVRDTQALDAEDIRTTQQQGSMKGINPIRYGY